MLRHPIHGFAKPVDDAVVRAMTILQNREDYTAKRSSSLPAHKPQNQAWKTGGHRLASR
jgi:hypothetical protein